MTEGVAPRLVGLAGAPVRSVVVHGNEGLEAWVATIEVEALRATGQSLAALALLHNEVVEAALATGRTPLPARFGTRFADDEALVVDLQKRHRQFIARLHRVASAVEMSVLVVPRKIMRVRSSARPGRDEPSAGRRYLEALRERSRSEAQRYSDANSAADRVSRAVSRLTDGEVRSSSGTALSLAHLVRRADVERYRLALSELDVGEGLRIIVAGPRAPYSFAAD